MSGAAGNGHSLFSDMNRQRILELLPYSFIGEKKPDRHRAVDPDAAIVPRKKPLTTWSLLSHTDWYVKTIDDLDTRFWSTLCLGEGK